MIQSTFKALVATAVGATALSLTVAIESAQAAKITYDFSVDLQGSNQGTYNGNFSYDDANLANKGIESVTPAEDGLQVAFNFLGVTYTEKNDLAFNSIAQFPQVFFENGKLLGLSFLVVPPTANPGFLFVPSKSFIPGTTIDQVGFYVGTTVLADNRLNYGELRDVSITYTKTGGLPGNGNPVPGAGVPEPSEIAGTLFAAGLLGLGLRFRKRLKTVQIK